MITNPNTLSLFNNARKLAIFMLLFSSIGISSSAQDILKLKTGKEIKVTVTEETNSVIKYREYENPTGPVYSIGRDKVESVKYKKGTGPAQQTVAAKDTVTQKAQSDTTNQEGLLVAKKRSLYIDGVAQSARSIRLLMEDQPEARKEFDKSKKLFTASNACPLIIILITWPANLAINGMTEQSDKMGVFVPVMCIDGALIIAGIILSKKGKNSLRNSANLYNSTVAKPAKYSFNFGIQENGVGIALKF